MADRLHLVLRAFMLRRLKEDVTAELPTKVTRARTHQHEPSQLAIGRGRHPKQRLQDFLQAIDRYKRVGHAAV